MLFSLIVTGGFTQGVVSNCALGFRFKEEEKDGLNTLLSDASVDFASMNSPRFLHQTVVVKGKGGLKLVAIGGRSSLSNDSWLNSVEVLDLKYYLHPGTFKKEKKAGVEEDYSAICDHVLWETVAPMKNARANFAAVVVNDEIYVFGGFKGRKDTHIPLLADTIEKYDPKTDQWTDVIFKDAPSLAAFSWTYISETKIIVLGGTNGSMISQNVYIIDFEKKECIQKEGEVDTHVELSKLAYKASEDALYIFGGKGSDGLNYKL